MFFNWYRKFFGIILDDDVIANGGVDGRESVSGDEKRVVSENRWVGSLKSFGTPRVNDISINVGAFVKMLRGSIGFP